jgi:UDP-GlcNAc3NAcA epimerase
MKIAAVVGARPQFIKAAMVSRLLRARPGVQEVLIHTGQHYDDNMSQVFFDELEIADPEYNLEVGSGPHGKQTGRMLEAIEKVLSDERPDRLLVYGDTNSTLAGAVAAAKLHVPVAHVEAGLRSFNKGMAEEVNRIVADHVSDLLFAPTEEAIRNLAREGMPKESVHLVGDVMYDAALCHAVKAERVSTVLQRHALNPKAYVLVTVHRAETTDDPKRLRTLIEGFSLVAKQIPLVWPLHPRTNAALERHDLIKGLAKFVKLIEPLGYLDMVMLEKHAFCIATDSGGVQKEAFFHRVPCVTLREETEWVELIRLGWNKLVPPVDAHLIADEVLRPISSPIASSELYGGGRAADRIVEILTGENQ